MHKKREKVKKSKEKACMNNIYAVLLDHSVVFMLNLFFILLKTKKPAK